MYCLVKLIRKFLLRAPLGFSLFLGETIGAIFYLNKRKRGVAFRNLKQAFPQKSNRQLCEILRKSSRCFGLSIIENLIIPRILAEVKIEGRENVSPLGNIFVNIHEGNWELYVASLANDFPSAVLVNRQKNKILDKLINELRRESKIRVCFSLRELIRALRDNYAIGLVIDQGEEENAAIVDFFSHLVPMPRGAVYLAKKFNREIYPIFGFRKKDFSHTLQIGTINPEGKEESRVLKELNGFYEKKLTEYPEQYLWYHKRFKRKRDLEILIISDRKPGHLKQSEALVSFFSEVNPQIKSQVVEVEYRSRLGRVFAELFSFFSAKEQIGFDRVLKSVLKKSVWEKLEKTFADIVISTGSITAPVNKMFSSFLGAKSVVILRPNIPLGKFDLAILPEHDRASGKNVVKIKGSLVYPLNFEQKAEKCKDYFNLSAEKKIALFLGGAIFDEKDFMRNLKFFVAKLKDFTRRTGYKILLSTSRRTPPAAEKFLEEALGKFADTEAFVIVNRANLDFIFDGFIALSEIVFVSSESISMISEALAFKKRCVCAVLERVYGKYKVFIDSLKEELSILYPPYNLKEIKPKVSGLSDLNKKAVRAAVRRLI